MEHDRTKDPASQSSGIEEIVDQMEIAKTKQKVDALPDFDFPEPPAANSADDFIWDEDVPVPLRASQLAARLVCAGDIYRDPHYARGLLLGSNCNRIPPTPIVKGKQLSAIIADRVRVLVVKEGKSKGRRISNGELDILLSAEVFLRHFPPVDSVINVPRYLPDFTMTRPGYNDGGRENRFLLIGEEPPIATSLELIPRFLDVMAFASEADRTNTVAGALTVVLRNHFPGAKPIIVVTSTKSHGGKDTVILFIAGLELLVCVSYQQTDWALERCVVGGINTRPGVGVLNIENARLNGRMGTTIASAFLERTLTNPEMFLFSTGTGSPQFRNNDIVFSISTNYGTVSEDLMNRALPIHLNPVGDVAQRETPIGNPKLEFLPANNTKIQAELRHMIEKWKKEGKPLDKNVKHPFSAWSQCIGGILQANGFNDFLANYSVRKTADDPVRKAIGLLGAAKPNIWLRPEELAKLAEDLGVVKGVIPESDRDSESSRARGIGVVLSAHRSETFSVETDDKHLILNLERARRHFGSNNASTRYRFQIIDTKDIPVDESSDVLEP